MIKNNFTKKKILGGLAFALCMVVGGNMASAQTTTPTPTATPNVPTTGAGGNVGVNILLMSTSMILASGGIYTMLKRQKIS